MTRKTALALTGAILAAALTPSLAAAAANPPTMDMPPSAQYGSIEIPMNLAVAMGLNCNLIGPRLTCYQTQDEAFGAIVEASNVVAASGCVPAMTLADGASMSGATINITTQGVWINLSSVSFDNRTSSWRTGCVGGYLADGTGGAGTRIGLAAGGQQNSLGSFNNLASSARRCPC